MMIILLAGNSIISKEHLRQVIKENDLQGEIVTGVSESEALTESLADGAGQYLPRCAAKKTSPISAAVAFLVKIFFGAMLLVMAVLAFFLIQSSLSGGVPSVAGYQMYIVLSGSMSPAFDTGSLAFMREIDPAEIVTGDIITYRGAGSGGTLTTHRVVDVNTGSGLEFTTRGDANNINDPTPVPAGNIIGKVYGSVPYLGYLMNFVQTRQGLIFMVFIPGTLVIFYELRNIYKYMGQMETHQQKTGGRRRKVKS